MNLPIIKYRNVWFIISAALATMSAVCLIVFSLRLGIDFTGGSLMEVSFGGQMPAMADVRGVLAETGFSDTVLQPLSDNGMLIRLASVDEQTHQRLLADLKDRFGEVSENRFTSIGPTVSGEERQKAVWALMLVLVAICGYIAYAFRKVSRPVSSWKFGLITLIAALFHDVLLPLGIFAVLGRFLLVEINNTFVVAILTVLGFSVHDTIVVFDRIRENLIKTGGAFEEIVERSVNETLARSINTSLTTFFPLMAIFLLGGETLKWFALALIVGLAVGTYSSIFLCSPLLVVFQKRSNR